MKIYSFKKKSNTLAQHRDIKKEEKKKTSTAQHNTAQQK